MTKLYAKIRASAQVLFAVPLVFMLAGCGTGGGYYGGTPWMGAGNNGVVTNDPNRMPDVAWQTQNQRQSLINESQAFAQQQSQTANQTPAPSPAAPAPAKILPKVTAAILLPLTGKNAELGQSMLKAAQMALFDVGSANFELKPIDTKGTPDGAAAAAREAVDAGASLILGPVYAEDLKAVRAATASANIPVISFSTDWAQAGGNTYIMGFLPFGQLSRVVSYAQEHGVSRFAVYAPQTPYCDIVISALGKVGASVVKTGRYSAGQSDLQPLVNDFVKQNEGKFDALVLPVGGESLRTLAMTFNTAGVKPGTTRFIGTGLWDDAVANATPALYGGWYAAPDPKLRADFENRYMENYGGKPARLASLAYDATALAAVLAHSGDGNMPYSRDHLVSARGFAGIDGIFRFRSDGLAERGLAVLEVQSGKSRVVDPAPTAFISSGT